MLRGKTLAKCTERLFHRYYDTFATQGAHLLTALHVLQSLLPQHMATALTIITQLINLAPSINIPQHACMLNQSTPERSTLHHASAEPIDIAEMLRTQPIAGKFGGNAHGNSSHDPNLITTTYRLL